MPKTLQKPKKI